MSKKSENKERGKTYKNGLANKEVSRSDFSEDLNFRLYKFFTSNPFENLAEILLDQQIPFNQHQALITQVGNTQGNQAVNEFVSNFNQIRVSDGYLQRQKSSQTSVSNVSSHSEIEDPRRELAERILSLAHSGGITVAFYITQSGNIKGKREFKGQAGQFAKDHKALGLANGVLKFEVAMELTDSLPNLLQLLSAEIEHLLVSSAGSEKQESIGVPIRTLAIFTHGTRRGLQAGAHARWISGTLAPWVANIAPYLTSNPLITLYACSVAGTPPTGLPFAEDLRLSLMLKLEEIYGSEINVEPTVWGHFSAGHTTANVNLVEYHGRKESGSTDIIINLAGHLTALALEQFKSTQNTPIIFSDGKQKAIENKAQGAVRRILKAKTSRLDPTNIFIREIPFIGIERVWQYLSNPITPELSNLDLAPEALEKLTEGLSVFQTRFTEELDSLVKYMARLSGLESKL